MIRRYTLARHKRHTRIRARLSGTSQRPRLSIYRSNKSVICQLVDDVAGKTLVAVAGAHLQPAPKGTKTDRAVAVAQALADKALAQNISEIVFDRSGYQYHGRVKAVAEELRQKGLKF